MVINGVAAAVAREPDFAATGVRLRDLPPLPDGRFPSVAE